MSISIIRMLPRMSSAQSLRVSSFAEGIVFVLIFCFCFAGCAELMGSPDDILLLVMCWSVSGDGYTAMVILLTPEEMRLPMFVVKRLPVL